MGKMIDKITLNELDMMHEYRMDNVDSDEDTLKYGVVPADIKDILTPWEDAKANLFKMFDENLILTRSFEYAKNREELYSELNDLSCTSYGRKQREAKTFCVAYKNLTSSLLKKYSAMDYEDPKRREVYDFYYNLNSLTDTDYLIDGVYSGSSFEIIDQNTQKPIQITTGMKIMKAIGKVAKAYNLDGFENYRICHSQVIGKSKISGEICISIHPFDYWTMSDNESDWGSCMSWRDNGDYRQGTVEMMNSPTVIVAYIKSENDMIVSEVSEGSWNNKKWRQLFVVDEKCIVEVKPYPYENKEISKCVLSWLKELAETNLGWKYQDELQTWNRKNTVDYIDDEGHLIAKNKETEFIFMAGHMYSDFCTGNHLGYFTSKPLNQSHIGKYVEIKYSGVSECVICGDTNCIENDCHVACFKCLNMATRCEECGSTYEVYEFNGHYYCADCWDSFVHVCQECEDEVHCDDEYRLYVLPRYTEEQIEKIKHNGESWWDINDFISYDKGEILMPESDLYVKFCSKSCLIKYIKQIVKDKSNVCLYQNEYNNDSYYLFADDINSDAVIDDNYLFYDCIRSYSIRDRFEENQISFNEAMVQSWIDRYHYRLQIKPANINLFDN